MKGFLLFTLGFFLLSFNLRSQPTFGWAKQLTGGPGGVSIATDHSANVYTAGYFNGITDIDPGLGVFNLTSTDHDDTFILKMNASGEFVWAKSLEGTGHNRPSSITVDAFENIYITGYFHDTVDFDPGPGVFYLNSASSGDIFILKLDASGSFKWAMKIGDLFFDKGISVVSDAEGNIYVTGHFGGTVDFDPNAGVCNLTAAELNHDLFILKIDAFGNFLWAKNIGGPGGWAGCNSIVIDISGNVYAAGTFSGRVDFDPGASTFTLAVEDVNDVFIFKLNSSGDFVWAKKIGGTYQNIGGSYQNFGLSIALDTEGNVYTTGSFVGTVDFDPGAGTFTLSTPGIFIQNIFISKLNSAGNFIWAKVIPGTSTGDQARITTDAQDNIYLAGGFNGTADFDPGVGTFVLTSSGWYDIFISKFDSAGSFLWVKVIGSSGLDYINDIITDGCGNIFSTGYFSGTVDFNRGNAPYWLTSKGSIDIFTLKLEQLPIKSNAVSVIKDTICSGKSLLLNVSGGSLAETASWNWYSDSCGGVALGTGSSLEIFPVNTNTYFVRAENNCLATECSSLIINVKTNPKAAFTSNLSATCKSVNAELTNQSENSDRYLWNFGNGSLSGLINENYSFEYGTVNNISLIAINNNGCSDTLSLPENINKFSDYLDLRLPNIFTPNNDGVNDLYKINLKPEVSDCFSISIFNRWGQPLFSSFKPNFEWDGIYQGSKLSAGVYFYILEINKEKFEGHISLLE